jgi:hypothetical protein
LVRLLDESRYPITLMRDRDKPISLNEECWWNDEIPFALDIAPVVESDDPKAA